VLCGKGAYVLIPLKGIPGAYRLAALEFFTVDLKIFPGQ